MVAMKYIGNIFHVLISLVLIEVDGHSIISSALETALQQDWSLSSTFFEKASGSSIVAYDQDKEKVIIFGGFSDNINTSESYWIGNETDWSITYIYDIETDRLAKIPFNLLDAIYDTGYFFNYATTNAIVMDSFIYFALEFMVIRFDLSELYLVENAPSLANKINIQETDLLDPTQDDYYGYQGCVVTDGSKDYFYIAGTGNKNVIICSLSHQGCMAGGKSLHKHNGGVCVVMDNILYLIGGINTNVTEYVNVSKLLYNDGQYQFTKHKNVFQGELAFNDKTESDGGRAVIQDDENKIVYILGGANDHNRDIHKMDIAQQTMELLDMKLPEPGLNCSTTILSQSNGRIYAFRGMNGWNADKIAFSTSIYYSNDPTVSPSEDPSVTPSNSPTNYPTNKPSWAPTIKGETRSPSIDPTISPSSDPSYSPSIKPTTTPTTSSPTANPTTSFPTPDPTKDPSANPSQVSVM